MALKLRDDPDLQVLHFADDQALGYLVRHLTHSESGQVRGTQSLLLEPRFKNVGTEYSKAWDLVGAELQHYGGDSIANLIRRQGVTYREILTDVCKSLWLHVDATKSTVQIENDLLGSLHQFLWMATMQMTGEMPTQPVEVPIQFSEDVEQRVRDDLSIALRMGTWMPSYISALRIRLSLDVLKGLSLSTIVAGGVATLLAEVVAGNSLLDASGPSFEVTTPAIFFIAYLRRNLDQDVY